jgi:hypothetical protein
MTISEETIKNDSFSVRPKQKFSVNDNLLLSLYSLMDETKKEICMLEDSADKEQQQLQVSTNNLITELDIELANNLRKVTNEQDNWSFRRSKVLVIKIFVKLSL